jgi:hypothetical protein
LMAKSNCCEPIQYSSTTVRQDQTIQVTLEVMVSGTTTWESNFVYAEMIYQV